MEGFKNFFSGEYLQHLVKRAAALQREAVNVQQPAQQPAQQTATQQPPSTPQTPTQQQLPKEETDLMTAIQGMGAGAETYLRGIIGRLTTYLQHMRAQQALQNTKAQQGVAS